MWLERCDSPIATCVPVFLTSLLRTDDASMGRSSARYGEADSAALCLFIIVTNRQLISKGVESLIATMNNNIHLPGDVAAKVRAQNIHQRISYDGSTVELFTIETKSAQTLGKAMQRVRQPTKAFSSSATTKQEPTV